MLKNYPQLLSNSYIFAYPTSVESTNTDLQLYVNFFNNVFKETLTTNALTLNELKERISNSLKEFTNKDFISNEKKYVSSFFNRTKIYANRYSLTKSHDKIKNFISVHENMKNGIARSLSILSLIYGSIGLKEKHSIQPIAGGIEKRILKYDRSIQIQLQKTKNYSYFHPLTPFVEYLAKNHQGIDCSDMSQVRAAIHALLRAKMLLEVNNEQSYLIDHALIDNELERVETAVINYAESQEEIDETAFNNIRFQLMMFKAEDPFALEFRNNPELSTKLNQLPDLARLRQACKSISEYYNPSEIEANLIAIEDNEIRYINFDLDPTQSEALKRTLLQKPSLRLTFFDFGAAKSLAIAYNQDTARNINFEASLHYDEGANATTIHITNLNRLEIMKVALLNNPLLRITFFNIEHAKSVVKAYNEDPSKNANLQANFYYDERSKITTIWIANNTH